MSFAYEGQATVDFYFDLVNERNKQAIDSHPIEISRGQNGDLIVIGFPDPSQYPIRVVVTLADGRVFDGAMPMRSKNIFSLRQKTES